MMDLVLDANVFFSALILKEGKTRELLLDRRLALFAPEFLLEESNKYLEMLSKKTRLSKQDVQHLIKELFYEAHISVFASPELGESTKAAKWACPDPNDAEYFALAITLGCPIWSNDKKLKEQSSVKVYSTKEVAELISQM